MLVNTSEYKRIRANSSECVRVRASTGEDAQIRANLIEYGGRRASAGECKWVSECVSRAGDAVNTGVKAIAVGRTRADQTDNVVHY